MHNPITDIQHTTRRAVRVELEAGQHRLLRKLAADLDLDYRAVIAEGLRCLEARLAAVEAHESESPTK